jgi:hypothetical protein
VGARPGLRVERGLAVRVRENVLGRSALRWSEHGSAARPGPGLCSTCIDSSRVSWVPSQPLGETACAPQVPIGRGQHATHSVRGGAADEPEQAEPARADVWLGGDQHVQRGARAGGSFSCIVY